MSSSVPLTCSDVCKSLLPVGIVAVGTTLAIVGMLQVQEGNRIVLRDTSESLSFIQDLIEFLGMILPSGP